MHVKNLKKNFFSIEFFETFMHIMDAHKISFCKKKLIIVKNLFFNQQLVPFKSIK